MTCKRIEKLVKRALRGTNCKYKIEDGIVTIEGKVRSYEEFVQIGRRVGKIKGVIGVVNNLDYPEKKRYIKTKPAASYQNLGYADVVIIGGGVIGCSIARELSRYKVKVFLVEKNNDVATGTTKANNALVHTGIGEPLGTLKQKLCIEGHSMFKYLSKELNIPYRETGLWIIISKDSLKFPLPYPMKNLILRFLIPFLILRRGKRLGIPLQIVKRKELFSIEPHVTREAIIAVYSPTYAVTDPFIFTITLAENAVKNGVRLFLDTEVVGIEVKDNIVKTVVTTKGVIRTRFVINAAGLYADEIARLAGAEEYTIRPKRGVTIIFDKDLEGFIKHPMTLLQFPQQEHYKGGGILYTFHGNIQWGPTIAEHPSKEDVSVKKAEILEVFRKYSPLCPDFPKDKVISYFTGLRACTFTEDFIIRASKRIKGFIHVAGIQSPGLTAAPAIAKMVVEILKKEGLHLEKKENFRIYPRRSPALKELPLDERDKLIKENPKYGKIICRCEEVSEGEIIDAIHSTIPATTIDAIKRRTRAGMGRCQGSFCMPKIAEILSREIGVPVERVTKKGGKSFLFAGRTRRFD